METALDQIPASEILQRLKHYGPLPTTGFLAGGAVANIILSIVDGTEYPINDLDVFYDSEKTGHDVRELFMPRRPTISSIMNIGYKHVDLRVIPKDSYRVLKAYRKESVNFIEIKMYWADSQNHNLIILNGFDINCCQAGVDLATEQLVFTDSFRDFLRSRQLHVTMPVTPYHTAIRLVKKVHELNAYCNVAEEISLLMHMPKLLQQDDANYPKYANFFGKRIYSLYKTYSPILDQFFTAVPYVKTAVKHIDDDPVPDNSESCHLPVRKEIIPLSRKGELYTLVPKAEIVIDEVFAGVERTDEFMAVWSVLRRGTKATALKLRKASRYSFPSLCSRANPQYVHCDFHEKHLGTIQKFFSAHPLMVEVLCSLNIQQQLKAIKLAEKMADEQGLFVIGLIEHGFGQIGPDGITEEQILALIDSYMREYEDLMVDPVDISEFTFKESVKELLTVSELMEEGRRMHHCVGGYARALKKGDIRIFHIEYGEERSTLEVMQYSIRSISILQHRGPWNKDVGIEHRKIGEAFVQFLNQKYGSRKVTEQIQDLFAAVER